MPRRQRPETCNVCGCVLDGTATQECNITGRIYVNTANVITGMTPPCPLLDITQQKFHVVDAFWLGGAHQDDVGEVIPNQERREYEEAAKFARFLGVYGQDFRATGIGEDEVAAREIVGGDILGDACRPYRFFNLYEDGE